MGIFSKLGIINTNNEVVDVQGSKNCIGVIDVLHKANHIGDRYKISYLKTVAASSHITVWLVSPSTSIECHMYVNYSADNSGYFDIWKGAVSATSQWASITPVNGNGFSTNATQVVAYTGGVPSTSTATLQSVESIGSGGKNTGGGSGGVQNEIILAPNSTYALRFVCTSTEADVSFDVNFYEEESD